MFEKIKLHLNTATARQTLVASVSTVANGLLGAAFYFFLARYLGAQGYGIFSVGVSLITTLSGVFDLGSDQSLIKFLPGSSKSDFYQYLKLAFFIKIFSGLVILLSLVLLSNYLAADVFRQPELTSMMFWIGIGVITQLLFSFATSIAQSLQRYYLWGILFIGTNLFRLMLLFGLYFNNNLNPSNVLYVYILLPFLGFLAIIPTIKFNYFKVKISHSVLQKFFAFNKWITGFVILSSINSRLDVFFVARYISISAVGIYSLCLQVVSVLPQLTSALGAVTSPKFSSFTTIKQNTDYVKKSSLLSFLFAFFSIAFLLPLSIFILNASGEIYLSGFSSLVVLLLSSAIFLITTPIRDSVLYYFGKPKVFFYAGIFQVILYVLIGPYLMENYSILGASLLVLINIIISSIFYLFTYRRLINDKNT